MIENCLHSPENCTPEDPSSKLGCSIGYIGPLCESCDTAGSVWGERYSLTDIFTCSACQDE